MYDCHDLNETVCGNDVGVDCAQWVMCGDGGNDDYGLGWFSAEGLTAMLATMTTTLVVTIIKVLYTYIHISKHKKMNYFATLHTSTYKFLLYSAWQAKFSHAYSSNFSVSLLCFNRRQWVNLPTTWKYSIN